MLRYEQLRLQIMQMQDDELHLGLESRRRAEEQPLKVRMIEHKKKEIIEELRQRGGELHRKIDALLGDREFAEITDENVLQRIYEVQKKCLATMKKLWNLYEF